MKRKKKQVHKLEDILHRHKLLNSKHDQLIKKTASNMYSVPNFLEIGYSMYYKLWDTGHKGNWLESDMDYIGLLYDHKKYEWVDDWKEIPFNESKILVWEMKTHNSTKNKAKAIYQLNRHNELIQTRTDYKHVDGFFTYWVGNSIATEYVELK